MNFTNKISVDKSKKVLCVGLLCLDMVTTCKAFPQEGTDQRCLSLHWQKGGNAANMSAVMCMLGHKVDFLGTVARSDSPENFLSDFVINEMKEYEVCMDNIVVHSDCGTPCSQVLINVENGSRTIVHRRKKLPELILENFSSLDHTKYSIIHFEGRNVEEVLKMMKFLCKYNDSNPKEQQIFISMEAEKPVRQNQVLMMPLADLVVISQDFAESRKHKNAVKAVESFKEYCKPGAFVVCPWGDSGAACAVAGNKDEVLMVPAAKPSQIVDTLGAGDTFLGGLLYALVHQNPLGSAVRFACEVAGHKVSAFGYDHVKKFRSATSNHR